jgi:hypothetical protein
MGGDLGGGNLARAGMLADFLVFSFGFGTMITLEGMV